MNREDLTIVSLWVHVPFVIAWFGLIMLDAFAVFGPGLSDEQRTRIVTWSRPFALIAIPVILATGIWQTMENPFYRVDSFSDLSELKKRTLYGDLLFWKHVFVVATVGLTIIIRFFLAPRVRAVLETAGGIAAEHGSYQLLRLAAVANLGAVLGAVLLATRMVAELH